MQEGESMDRIEEREDDCVMRMAGYRNGGLGTWRNAGGREGGK